MSDYERNKGKLIPTSIRPDKYTENLIDNEDFEILNGIVYEIDWKCRSERDEPDFCELRFNDDDTIDFHTYHYNGGAHWSELVEDKLEELDYE